MSDQILCFQGDNILTLSGDEIPPTVAYHILFQFLVVQIGQTNEEGPDVLSLLANHGWNKL